MINEHAAHDSNVFYAVHRIGHGEVEYREVQRKSN
jgi:hypothetical protein